MILTASQTAWEFGAVVVRYCIMLTVMGWVVPGSQISVSVVGDDVSREGTWNVTSILLDPWAGI